MGFTFNSETTLEDIRKAQALFAEERDWDQFHSKRNLLLAMVGEVGEVAELFQWQDDTFPVLESDHERVSEELSDVLLYLVRLADKCRIDLSSAVFQKMAKNAEKYPVNTSKGRSDKYTRL